MNEISQPPFSLPEQGLSSLPTGAVKDVSETLGRSIARGEFAAGERIPQESELVVHLGVSRTVVREAIKVLSGKGMVRTARRYGTRVRPFEEWHLLDPDVISWHVPDSPNTAKIYAESTDLRCMVEPGAAFLAAQNGSEAQKQNILDAAKAVHPNPWGRDAMMAADYAFHANILQASGNLMLAQFQPLILALLRLSYRAGAQAAPEIEISRDEHVAVAVAIERGQCDKARLLMSEMLGANRQVARKLLSPLKV